MARVDYRQGDYRVVAQRLRPAAQELVTAADVQAGQLVVDVGAGTGNVAHLCRARGARVVAVDRVHEQLALGRDEGEGVEWVAGDAQALPLADGVADVALSTFALIYAERPADAVAELGRTCRSGALLGLTAWAEGSYQAESAAVLNRLAGLRSSDDHDHITAWGTAEAVAARLSPVADVEAVEVRELRTEFPSLDAWWDRVSSTAPPLVTARATMAEPEWEALRAELRAVAAAHARPAAEAGAGAALVLTEHYLLALASVR